MRKTNRNNVAVHMMGGLGNQLFQFAVGLAVSRRANCELRLIVGDERDRRFELDLLARSVGARVQHRRGRAASAWHQVMGYFPHRIPGVVRERGFRFDERVLAARPPVELVGYFQSWRYFESVAAEVRMAIGAIEPRSPAFRRLQSEIGSEPFIAVHARRGDYVGLEHFHGLVSEGYLVAAHRRLVGVAERCLLFTDDPTWAPSAELGAQLRIVRPADLPDPFETLLLMSRARGLAIANSSFSWWAAWLGDAPGRPVIAPSPWFTAPHLDTRDLLPPHWHVLDRSTGRSAAPGVG